MTLNDTCHLKCNRNWIQDRYVLGTMFPIIRDTMYQYARRYTVNEMHIDLPVLLKLNTQLKRRKQVKIFYNTIGIASPSPTTDRT